MCIQFQYSTKITDRNLNSTRKKLKLTDIVHLSYHLSYGINPKVYGYKSKCRQW